MVELLKKFFNFYNVEQVNETTYSITVSEGETPKEMKLKFSNTIIDCYLDNQMVGSFFK